jgi:UDP-glucose 4-epimerase
MPRVLLTGSPGGAGQCCPNRCGGGGLGVEPFDLSDGRDLGDPRAVLEAMHGWTSALHAGALAHDTAGSPVDIVATNLLGTWHVLVAGEEYGLSRVVYFSSAQVLGFAEGEGSPSYLPVDDDHPVSASRPYGMSKRLAEDMRQTWTRRTGIPTIVLRPVMILNDHSLSLHSPETAELGAFVHVDDAAAATILGLTVDLKGHHRMTLCGAGSFDCA